MKKLVLKNVLLLLISVLIMVIYFIFTHTTENESIVTMKDASFPTITMLVEDKEVNLLHGYAASMEGQYFNEYITPIADDHKLSIQIARYGNGIAGISYEVRSVDTTRLIEDSKLESWIIDGDVINVDLNISNIITTGTQYLLIIKINTENHGVIAYYTRIANYENKLYGAQIDFVLDYSEKTRDEELSEELVKYMEPDSKQDNTNLGYVNIHSNFNQLTWGELKVERVTEPRIVIRNLIGTIGCYEISYTVRAKNDFETYQYYSVTEYMRIKPGVNVTYVDSYERKMDQIFEVNNQNISTSRINLGIDSDKTVKYYANDKGSIITFIKNKSLYCMDMSKNVVTDIFSFRDKSSDGVRENYEEHDIDVIRILDNKDVEFIVYGYMNKGEHEGQVGLGYYRYSYEDNVATELVFVPSTKPYEILKDTINELAYVNKDNVFYVMLDDSIYTITLSSNEYMQVATGLKEGNYVINNDRNIIAWHTNQTEYEATQIRYIDIVNGIDKYIDASSKDEYVKAAGFIDNDFVYGIAYKKDIAKDANGKLIFPMYKLNICLYNTDNQVETYEKSGIYVTDIKIEATMLRLSRVKKDTQTGQYVNAEQDQLTNSKVVASTGVTLSTIATDLKKTEVVLKFAYTLSGASKITEKFAKDVIFTSTDTLKNRNIASKENVYYVYYNGENIAKYGEAYDAIESAYNKLGTVIDNSGAVIWERITKPLSAEATDVVLTIGKYTDYNTLYNDYLSTDINVNGISLDKLLCFLVNGSTLLVKNEDATVELIYGFKGPYQGVINTIYVMNPLTGDKYTKDYDTASAQYTASGNKFIVMKTLDE